MSSDRAAPGFSRLLAAGTYRHPDADAVGAAVPEAGVLMLKPGVELTTEGLTELAGRVAGCGYVITDARIVSPDEVTRDGLLRRHYHDHWEVARAGRLLPAERELLVARYDRLGVEARCGSRAADIPVIPALALASRAGVALAAIGAWADRTALALGIGTDHVDACQEVGELADVQLLADPREVGADEAEADRLAPLVPCFVLNPQMATLASWWEDGGDATLVALLRPGGPAALPWREMRSSFLGTGSPDAWPAGSLRGDMRRATSALHYREGIEMGVARNGVHLSSGPVEALREVTVWFDRQPLDTVIGRQLARGGVDPSAVLDAVYVDDGTRVQPIASLTEHAEIAVAAAMLRDARLLGAADIP